MDSPLTFATYLARQAGELLLSYFRRASLQTSLKADHTVVTEADIAADRLIAAAIHERFPQDLLLSEELQPTYMEGGESSKQPLWIIDPLDGTTNFSLGLHVWGVLITRLIEGWPESSVMYFPLIGELYAAQLGQGAFLNNELIQVRPPGGSGPKTFFTCCSRTYRQYTVTVPYKTRILGSAGYSLCCVARGMALLGFESTAKVWDISGGWLLVKEAGGAIETLDGSLPFPVHTGVDYARQSYPTLAAATPELLVQGHHQIQPRAG